MRPRAIAAAVRFAARQELPEPPLWVCPPCLTSHGSTPLTPAPATQHGHTPLTRYELAIAAKLLSDVRHGAPLAIVLLALAKVDREELVGDLLDCVRSEVRVRGGP